VSFSIQIILNFAGSRRVGKVTPGNVVCESSIEGTTLSKQKEQKSIAQISRIKGIEKFQIMEHLTELGENIA
jgi:hypothetical protein